MRRYSNKELNIIQNKLKDGKTYREITDLIYKEFNIRRSIDGVQLKARKMGWKSTGKLKSQKDFETDLYSINKNIKVIGTYINSSTKIKLKCKIDNSIWTATPNNLLAGKGCPTCKSFNNNGSYQNLTKEQAENIGFVLYLYHIKLQYKDEVFYKYGLTKFNDRRRFNGYTPYSMIKEISFEKYDAWTAICKEKELKSNYIPLHKFSGYGECYKNKGTIC